jgi:hypothetical protein
MNIARITASVYNIIKFQHFLEGDVSSNIQYPNTNNGKRIVIRPATVIILTIIKK